MIYATKKLKEMGYKVTVTGLGKDDRSFSEIPLPDAMKTPFLLFGLPFTRDGETIFAPFAEKPIFIEKVIKELCPGQTVLAGNIGAQKSKLESAGARVFDYFLDEDLTLFNAFLTAEALTSILIETLPHTLSGAKIALVGYGRIGKYLSRLLKAFGAEVFVFARRAQTLEEAKEAGCESENITNLSTDFHRFHALINTVPSPCIGENQLRRLNGGCVLVEAASAPYGIDFTLSEEKGFRLIKAFSLPGKYSPLSAGERIAITADKILSGGDTDA